MRLEHTEIQSFIGLKISDMREGVIREKVFIREGAY